MIRRITAIATVAALAAAAAAACTSTSTDGTSANNGDGDGTITGIGDGDITPPTGDGTNIYYESPAEGFVGYDDGSGNPAYRTADVTDEQVTALQAALASNLTPDANSVFFYPFEETMVPWNLSVLSLQWRVPTGAASTIMLRATGSAKTYHIYLKATCANSGYCDVTVPSAEWQTIGRENAGQDVTFELVATDGVSSYAVTPMHVRFSPDDLLGALYYWASASRTIKRASFGADHAVAFIKPGENVNYECVSCHSVSRDGSTIAFGVSPEEGENIAGIQVASTSDPNDIYIEPTKGTTPFSATVAHGNTEGPIDSLGHNVALSPDGALMAVNATSPPDNWPIRLDIKRTDTKDSVLQSYELGSAVFGAEKIGIHPEFSPTGSKLVVTLAENNGSVSAWTNTIGGIATMTFDAATGTLGTATTIATPPAGAFYFYPTWSPDEKYIAFVASWDTSVGSLGNRHGVLYMVPSTGGPYTCPGAGCYELVRGTGYSSTEAMAKTGTSGSTWPKFSPFAQGTNKDVYFISFTSRRERGTAGGGTSQIWMFGVDMSETGGDVSFSPFWLPYQEPSDGSLAPYWTETLPCDTTGETCNGCVDGESCIVNRETNACRCASLVPR